MENVIPNRTPIRSVCFTGHRDLPPRTTAAYRQLVIHKEAAIRRAFERETGTLPAAYLRSARAGLIRE